MEKFKKAPLHLNHEKAGRKYTQVAEIGYQSLTMKAEFSKTIKA